MNGDLSAAEVAAACEAVQRSVNQPNIARMYDYLLNGGTNFAVDREAVQKLLARTPSIREAVHANRRFLHRAVGVAVDAGVRQFLDIGAGLPTAGAVHEICEHLAPGACTVVYVDNDPVVHAHAVAALQGQDRHAAVNADFLDVATVLAAARERLDLAEPVCLILLALLHFVPDPHRALSAYRCALAPGSLTVISHAFDDAEDTRFRETVADYERTNSPMLLRDREEIADLFGNWPVLHPGLVWLSQWQPDPDGPDVGLEPALTRGLCGVAIKDHD